MYLCRWIWVDVRVFLEALTGWVSDCVDNHLCTVYTQWNVVATTTPSPVKGFTSIHIISICPLFYFHIISLNIYLDKNTETITKLAVHLVGLLLKYADTCSVTYTYSVHLDTNTRGRKRYAQKSTSNCVLSSFSRSSRFFYCV